MCVCFHFHVSWFQSIFNDIKIMYKTLTFSFYCNEVVHFWLHKKKNVIAWLSPLGRANNWRSGQIQMKSNVLSVASVDLILSMLIMFCFGFKLFLQKWKQFWYISSLKMKLINTQCTYLLLFQISYQLCSLKNLHLQPTSNLSVVELQVAEEKPDCVSVSFDQIQSF